MGIIYSTDASYKFEDDKPDQPRPVPGQQKLRVRLDKKHRGGKAVTLVEGYTGSQADAADLGKQLKSHCGTGGAVKDGEIIVQGDNREKVFNWLLKNGFTQTKKM